MTWARGAAASIGSGIRNANAAIASRLAPWISDLLILFLATILLVLAGSSDAHAAGAGSTQPPAKKLEPEIQSALYLGTLLTLDQDQGGAIHRGADLVTLRFVGTVQLPAGIRFGGRVDATSLGAIDPSNLDVKSLRTVEGYGALSWSRQVVGLDVGAAAATGALIPIENTVEWRYQALWAGGLRLGRGRSWLYTLAGSDGAADVACSCSGGVRAIFAGSVELGRFAVIGDFVAGAGGRARGGILYRIPMP